MKNNKSSSFFERAQKTLPGGVNSPVRSFRSVGGKPFIAESGDGAYLRDIDGNTYVDLVSSWGALIHGHNHPRIRESITEALRKGTSFGVTGEREVLLAEKMKSFVPGFDLVRLVNSGTEACMSAIRLARGATKRELILKFDGHYHGHGDSFLVAAGSGVAALHESASAGVPQSTVDSTLVIAFNDRQALAKVFDDFKGRIAGVMLEVVCGNMGCVLPDPEFLRDLRRLTQNDGALLIFDEVMTGFRLSRGGAQEIYGIEPDLSCFGKIMGGGLPVGAYGGRRDIMENVAPLGSVYQAGTLSGNPLGAAAGLASLELIEEEGVLFFQNLDAACSEWRSQLEAHIRSKGYPASVNQMGSMLSVFFCPEAPTNYAEAKKSDLNKFKTFFWSMLEQGVYYPPSQFESCFLSACHTGEVIDRVVEVSLSALDKAYGV
jgi:glutamate-1-semialdehyde 2,1-aminomutase